MSSGNFTESVIEQATLAWLESMDYTILSGPEIAPGEVQAERENYGQVVMERRLRQALQRLNPQVPADALEEAFRKLTRPDTPSLVANNHTVHRYLVEGVPVEYQRQDGSIGGDLVRVLDYETPDANEFVAVNQFTVVEDQRERRPDIVLFVNGLPLGVIELKNAATESATIWSAFNQLQTYKQQIPSLFAFNEAMVISDGVQARIGTLTADKEWFMPWRTIEGEALADVSLPQLQVVLEGIFDKRRFLDLIRHFIVFEDIGGGVLIKKMAGYHQYHAVNVALAETLRACMTVSDLPGIRDEGTYFARQQKDAKPGDRRVGVIWHTQGSGKSLTMAFYAGRVVLHPAMENPTIVVITDRNDLDDQLYGTFARCHELLRQEPVQARNREHLRDLLQTASGGVVFTTVQKFFPAEGEDRHPLLSDRRNIVVIADEAHRSQYDFIDGFARHMREALPKASFIGFTGTPIELSDKNTRAVFGDYVSIYDIERAVKDGATVPIYYESRLAKLELKESERPRIDPEFEEVTEGEEVESKEKLKTKWAQLEALVGAEKRVRLIAEDLVKHFEGRLEAMDGKAMIVGMSRRICVELYNAITAIRPDWKQDYQNDQDQNHDDDANDKRNNNQISIKIVMTGSAADPVEWQGHIRNKARRETLAKRFKDPQDSFKIVIVRDMWLTGFDAPCLHTMYMDKPMRSHGLMQAIARVNRVFKDKPGGLVVDYLGLAHELKSALANYTESGGQGRAAIDQDEAVTVMLEKFEICCGIFHGFDWSKWKSRDPQARLSILPAAQEHVLIQKDGKRRLSEAVVELSQTFALAVPHEKALAIRDDVAFFQAMKAVLGKSAVEGRRSPDEIEHAIRQIVSRAVSSDEVIDIFAAAGLKKPDISILSEEFLAEVRGMPQRNLAVEMLRKLLDGEVKRRSRKNIVQGRSFAEMLENAIKRYQARAIEAAQVIEELIALARDMREADRRGEALGLTEDEVAFYDALETNDSAVKVLGDETLRTIAQELLKTIRNNVTIDWTVRENVRAQMRVMIKRILRRYGYPPDKQARATELVLEQAEVLSQDWAEKG
ncbi:MAG: type I restriction endonuclease subunit R [Syntrophales bacterium]|nr:type I restriction endonuclease subunit R [Syntrophales bacterium]